MYEEVNGITRIVADLDAEGDVEGLMVVNGVGYETDWVPQVRPDTKEQVRRGELINQKTSMG